MLFILPSLGHVDFFCAILSRVIHSYSRAPSRKTNTNWPKPGPSTLAVGPATRPTEEFFRLGDDEKDDKLWQILSGLSDDAKAICFANTKRQELLNPF